MLYKELYMLSSLASDFFLYSTELFTYHILSHFQSYQFLCFNVFNVFIIVMIHAYLLASNFYAYQWYRRSYSISLCSHEYPWYRNVVKTFVSHFYEYCTPYLYIFITWPTSSPQIWQALSAGQQDKRAPSGFLGMRGKKWGDEGDDDFSLYHKRAPSGFLGMRGWGKFFGGVWFGKGKILVL